LNNAGASLEDLARMGNTSIPMLVGSYMKWRIGIKQKSLPKCQKTQDSEKIAYT